MILIKKFILTIINKLFGEERTIKIKEYLMGLYRYPTKMIGRKMPTNFDKQTDILVFAAHPDDEILGLGTILYRHKMDNKKVTVVYVTDGTGHSGPSWSRKRVVSEKISETRYREGIKALSLINISKENVLCLGFPDGGTHRYLKQMAADIEMLIENLGPQKIYVHCIEGGHNDHDLVSLVVKSVCNKLNFTNVFEWAEYSPMYPLGVQKIKFMPKLAFHDKEMVQVNITEKERIMKRKMLACHESQNVESLYGQDELIRIANMIEVDKEIKEYFQFKSKEMLVLVNKFFAFFKRQLPINVGHQVETTTEEQLNTKIKNIEST